MTAHGPRHRIKRDFRSKLPEVPKGWESKMRSALKHNIGTVLTAAEVHELALVVGLREAGAQ